MMENQRYHSGRTGIIERECKEKFLEDIKEVQNVQIRITTVGGEINVLCRAA